MATEIGSVAVDIIRGVPQGLKTRVGHWQVPGLDGYGAQLLGKGNSESELTTVAYCDDNDDANTHISSCRDLIGTIVSITDNFGDTYTEMLVIDVDSSGPNSKKRCIKDGNADCVRVEQAWKVCRVSSDDGNDDE